MSWESVPAVHTELPYSLKVHSSQLLRTFPDLVNCFPEVGHQCFYPFFVINNVMNVLHDLAHKMHMQTYLQDRSVRDLGSMATLCGFLLFSGFPPHFLDSGYSELCPQIPQLLRLKVSI